MIFSRVASRGFSGKVQENLRKTLEKEIEFQRKQLKLDLSLSEFIKKKKIKVSTTPLHTHISLQGPGFEVNFTSRSLFQFLPESAYLYEGQDNKYTNSMFSYSITLKKSLCSIQYFLHTSESKLYITSIFYNSQSFSTTGNFKELHPDTQQEFISLLERFDLTSSLADFIGSYSLYRDEQLSIEWMGKIKNFLK